MLTLACRSLSPWCVDGDGVLIVVFRFQCVCLIALCHLLSGTDLHTLLLRRSLLLCSELGERLLLGCELRLVDEHLNCGFAVCWLLRHCFVVQHQQRLRCLPVTRLAAGYEAIVDETAHNVSDCRRSCAPPSAQSPDFVARDLRGCEFLLFSAGQLRFEDTGQEGEGQGPGAPWDPWPEGGVQLGHCPPPVGQGERVALVLRRLSFTYGGRIMLKSSKPFSPIACPGGSNGYSLGVPSGFGCAALRLSGAAGAAAAG